MKILLSMAVAIIFSFAGYTQTLSDSLQGHYHFNGSAYDSSGKGNHGTLIGGLSPTTDRWGRSIQAYEYDGVNDAVDFPDDFDYQQRTISIWFSPNSFKSSIQAIYVSDHGGLDYGSTKIWMIDSTLWFGQGSGKTYTFVPGFKLGEWYMVSMTVNADSTKLYLCDELLGAYSSFTSHSSSGNSWAQIGKNRFDINYFEGKLDDLRVYNRVLSGSEIAELCSECINTYSSLTVLGGCDEYTSPSGKIFDRSGVIKDTIPNDFGCDSIITITLDLDSSTHATETVVACESYTSPSGLYIWSSTGTYNDTIPNMAGCDSILTYNVTIDAAPDTSVTISGSVLTAGSTGVSYQWIDCNTMMPISGATSSSYVATATGNYAVILTNGSCVDTSACKSVVITSIFQKPPSTISVSPNPTTGRTIVDLAEYYENIEVRIYGVFGQLITYQLEYQTDKFEVELMEDPGVYVLDILVDGGVTYTIKIVKQER